MWKNMIKLIFKSVTTLDGIAISCLFIFILFNSRSNRNVNPYNSDINWAERIFHDIYRLENDTMKHINCAILLNEIHARNRFARYIEYKYLDLFGENIELSIGLAQINTREARKIGVSNPSQVLRDSIVNILVSKELLENTRNSNCIHKLDCNNVIKLVNIYNGIKDLSKVTRYNEQVIRYLEYKEIYLK